MEKFPVEYSSLSADALLQFIIEQYALDSTSSIVFLKRGFNDTYLIISKGEKFVCRVYKYGWRGLETIENEVDLLLYLKQNDTSVAIPVENTKQKRVLKINAPEGVRYLVLFTYARGQRVRKLSTDQAFLLGVETAKMHLLTKDKVISPTAQDYTISKQFTETIQVLTPILIDYPKQFQLLQELEKFFLKEFNSIKKGELAEGICHGDLQAENFHIDENGSLTFFDFDFFGKGYLIYDIGVFMWYDHKNKPPEIIKAFLKGYESKRLLTPTEHKFIPWLSTMRALFQMTLYCRISDGKQLPLWPAAEVAAFLDKVEKWQKSARV
ncbi:MAG TPA: phosphotransferase [Bacteroidia bacterium]|nr:phosphotransferase [Bacteroidia bacterium]